MSLSEIQPSFRTTAMTGVKWASVSLYGRQGLQFIGTAILAQLLAPSDYGLYSMAILVVKFFELFKDLGTSSAIIQREHTSEVLLSSIFWVNVSFGFLILVLMVIGAPAISSFYGKPELVLILRVLSVSYFLSSLGILHSTLLHKRLRFDLLAKVELISALLGTAVAITFALRGCGAWSLVFQMISTSFITTLLAWMTLRWRPLLAISWEELRGVFSYSMHLSGFTLCNYFARNADYILIGRFLGPQNLGYYTMAYQLMLYPIMTVSSIISRVLFPILSRLQTNDSEFRKVYLKVCLTIGLLTFPMMCGLFVAADSFILGLIGKTWEPVIPILMILIPVGLFQSVGTTVGLIYQVKAKTRALFLWGIASSALITFCFLIGINWGTTGVSWSYLLASVILLYPNFAIPFRFIGLNFIDLVINLRLPFFSSILMLLILVVLKSVLRVSVELSPIHSLAVLVLAGTIVYTIFLWLFNRKELVSIWSMMTYGRGSKVCANGSH